ncbi:MAG TPA: DUF4267 domain-containing protein [Ktedonobacterales bacterium]
MTFDGALSDRQARRLAAAIGVSMIAFGAAPAAAPGVFARIFGFAEPDAQVASMMRSLGARDIVMGVGLWSAASHGGKFLPWTLARILVDGSDTLAVGLAIAQGKRDPRFIALGALALGATLSEMALYLVARASQAAEE